MLKRYLGLMVIIAVAYGTAYAEERPAAKETGLSAWFKELQRRSTSSRPRKRLPVSTDVAGVPGKGDSAGASSTGKEEGRRAGYRGGTEGVQGVDGVREKGDTTAAIKELDEFMKQYPDSALIPACQSRAWTC